MTKRAHLYTLCFFLCIASGSASAQEKGWQAVLDAGKAAAKEHRDEDAEKLFKEALGLAQALPEADRRRDERILSSLFPLASLYVARQQYDKAAEVYELCLWVLGKTYGKANPRVCQTARRYAQVLRQAGRESEADQVVTCDKLSMNRILIPQTGVYWSGTGSTQIVNFSPSKTSSTFARTISPVS